MVNFRENFVAATLDLQHFKSNIQDLTTTRICLPKFSRALFQFSEMQRNFFGAIKVVRAMLSEILTLLLLLLHGFTFVYFVFRNGNLVHFVPIQNRFPSRITIFHPRQPARELERYYSTVSHSSTSYYKVSFDNCASFSVVERNAICNMQFSVFS